MEDKARHINFNKFVEDRSVQIAKFLVDLEMDTKKTGHQALPKSVRRRAMSHNRFRIPRRLRKNMQEQLAKIESMQKLPKCRKHIRKRRHLIAAYKMRSQKVQWLSTHLWAAKRMRMMNYYGFRIAFSPNNKSFRSAYRHSKHGCIVSDLSFYHAITLISKEISSELPPFINFKDTWPPDCGRLYETSIVCNDQLVCPCLLIRSQSQHGLILRIFFHPAAITQLKKLGVPQGWTASMQQGQTDLYCLNGPQSLQILETALKQYGIISKEENITNKFYAKKSPAIFFNLAQNNFVLENKPSIDAPISQQKLLIKGYTSKSNSHVRSHMLSLFNGLITSKMINQLDENESAFWKMFQEGQNHELSKITFKITLRSRYTHHRKKKLTKQQKKQVIISERQSSEERGRKKMKGESQREESSYQEKQIFVEEPNKKQDSVIESIQPVLVAESNGTYYVWASNSNSCRLWRILSKLNVKVIGRKQLNHYNLENGIKTFPEDFPQTMAFAEYRKEQITKNCLKYLKVPLPKRPNYLKLHSPSPFGPIIPSKPVLIELEIVSRGHCTAFSYICELLKEDLQKIYTALQSGYMSIVHSELGEGERKKYKNWDEFQNELKLVKTERIIIGSVTSGGYRYSRSKEGGIGFINSDLLSQNYLDRFGGYVLIRKPNSPHYMLGQILKKFDHF